MDRQIHKWNVTLQRDDGQMVDRPVSAFWDPEQEGCSEAVGLTAKAEAFWATKKKHEFGVIAVAKA